MRLNIQKNTILKGHGMKSWGKVCDQMALQNSSAAKLLSVHLERRKAPSTLLQQQ
jgi:hypothetical protein